VGPDGGDALSPWHSCGDDIHSALKQLARDAVHCCADIDYQSGSSRIHRVSFTSRPMMPRRHNSSARRTFSCTRPTTTPVPVRHWRRWQRQLRSCAPTPMEHASTACMGRMLCSFLRPGLMNSQRPCARSGKMNDSGRVWWKADCGRLNSVPWSAMGHHGRPHPRSHPESKPASGDSGGREAQASRSPVPLPMDGHTRLLTDRSSSRRKHQCRREGKSGFDGGVELSAS
jgi:hypothetical protein